MKKLTKQEKLECISPYLPYNLQVQSANGSVFEVGLVDSLYKTRSMASVIDFGLKPVLKPVRELFEYPERYQDIYEELSTSELQSLKLNFVEFPCNNRLDYIEYTVALTLIKNHFDVFGLLEQNLAVNLAF